MSYGNYPDLSKVKKVLVVKMRHHGDVLLTSPVFSCLKRAMPGAQIDAFVYKDTVPMLAGHTDITQFIAYDRDWKKRSFFSKLQKELSLLWQIRKNAYDVVINLTEGDRGAIISLVSGAKVKVGMDAKGRGFFSKDRIYTHKVKQVPNPRHTVEKQLDALRVIGIFPSLEERALSFHLPEDDIQKMKDLLAGEGVQSGSFVLIHPVSRWKFKCLPTETVATLIAELERRGKKVVLTSSPDKEERKMIEEILSHRSSSAVDLGGKVTLKQLGALIHLAQLVICVDSVPLHMASALKAPVVVVFGPTSEKNWGPWQHPQSRVVTQKMPCRPCFMDGCGGSKLSDCLYTLPASMVMEAAESLLVSKSPYELIDLIPAW